MLARSVGYNAKLFGSARVIFMSTTMSPTVADGQAPQLAVNAASYLTLHYRLASRDNTEIVTTFNDSPATLQMGAGQLSPALEQQLIGLTEGTRQTFVLGPDQAFGQRNPDLVQHVSLATLRENSNFGEDYVVGDLVEFRAPSGGKFAGVLRSIDDETGLFDFNHPLAGQELVFEVHIIGIL